MSNIARRLARMEASAPPPPVDPIAKVPMLAVCLARGQTFDPPLDDGHIVSWKYPDGSPIYARDVMRYWSSRLDQLDPFDRGVYRIVIESEPDILADSSPDPTTVSPAPEANEQGDSPHSLIDASPSDQ